MKPEGWTKHNLALSPYFDNLLANPPKETIDRVHHTKLSVEEFWEKYEKTGTPVIIEGLTENMEVEKYWSFKVVKIIE